MLSLRTSAHTGVAIPRIGGKCIDNCPTERETLRFLVIIITCFLSTGGLPRQCSHWLAMTAFFQTPTRFAYSIRSSERQFIGKLLLGPSGTCASFCSGGCGPGKGTRRMPFSTPQPIPPRMERGSAGLRHPWSIRCWVARSEQTARSAPTKSTVFFNTVEPPEKFPISSLQMGKSLL